MGPENDYDIQAILDEMRQAYWQGLSEQEEAPRELLECLVFTLGGQCFAFEVQHASEVIRLPKLARIPAVQETVRGVFNLRGVITAAMDIRPMLGLPQPELTGSARLLVVKGSAFSTAVMVEEVEGMHTLDFEGFLPASEEASPYIRGHFPGEHGPRVLLDLPALLEAPEFIIGEL